MDIMRFIATYFASKHVIQLTAFLCWSKGDISLLYRSASSTGIRIVVKTQFLFNLTLLPEGLEHPEGMLLDVDCPNADYVIDKASRNRAFNQRHIWLLLDNSTFNSSKVDSILAKAMILPDSDVVWSSPDTNVDLYRMNLERPLRMTGLEWSRNSSLQDMKQFWAQQPTQAIRRKDMDNVTVYVCSVITQPEYFTTWDDLSLKHIDILGKSARPLIMLLGEDLNLSYNFTVSTRYGELVNGSFTGCVGLVERGKVEIVAANMFKRKDRLLFVDYVTETFNFRFPFIFRQPSKSAVTNIFALPLSSGVWLASFIVFLLVLGFLAVISKFMVVLDPSLKILTVGETITFVIGAICQQGFSWTPKLQSIRVMMFFTFITSLFLFTSYSAKIVALLQTPSHAIKTVMDLATSQLTFGVQDTPYKRIYYELSFSYEEAAEGGAIISKRFVDLHMSWADHKENPPPASKYLYEKRLRPFGEKAFNYSVVEGVAKLRTGKFAFQVELAPGIDIIQKTFTESEKCGLNFIDTFRLGILGIPFKRHSGLKELAAVRFRWLRENGLMDHVSRIWYTSKPRCESGRINGFISVGLKEILPAVQVLVFGEALAILVLVQEIFFYKISHYYSKMIKKP